MEALSENKVSTGPSEPFAARDPSELISSTLGRDQTYFVSLERYEPTVKCYDRSPEPAPTECQGAIDVMPKAIEEKPFSDHDGNLETLLPQLFIGRESHQLLGL